METRYPFRRKERRFARAQRDIRFRVAHSGTRFGAAMFALALLLATSDCKRLAPTQLIVGVQSEPMGGIAHLLHIVVRVSGVVTRDEKIRPPGGSTVGFPQPWEARLTADSDLHAPVDVRVDVYGKDGEGAAPLFTRLSSARFVPHHEMLLRVLLESRCIVYPAIKKAKGQAPGPLSGPTCDASTTCIRGACRNPEVPPTELELFSPNWPTNAPDVCRPKNPGPPSVQIGTGQTGYTPLAPEQVLVAEAGPQGGHHIWIAVRMKNMKQAGSTTKISAVQPGTGVAIPPSSFAFTFDPDEGSYCKLYGLRYQLDNGGIDYTQFLGKPLDVTSTVVDSNGVTASSTAHIRVAPTIRNP
jgi:hypothetical protein